MRRITLLCVCIILFGCEPPPKDRQVSDTAFSDIKPDEHLVFFRTTAWLNEDTNDWQVPIHGWIYEPEDSTARKALFATVLDREFDLDIDETTEENFSRRINLMIADNERDKVIVINIAGRSHTLSASGANGHFESTITLSAAEVEPFLAGSTLSYSAVTTKGEPRKFNGEILFVKPTGLSVISDIDDTIKVSNVTDRGRLLENTFLLDFAAVPGMSTLYDEWATRDVSFHFVSSSPWQLYAPLQEFMDASGFPRSVLKLKLVRFRDETLFDLFKKGTETKPAQIESILGTYPDRQFVLVGDSGEQDPEVYAGLLRKYPNQILKVFIRNVTDESPDDERFSQLFSGIDDECWQLFDEPEHLTWQ